MSEGDVEVVRRLFELYASGGMEAALEVMDEDIQIVIFLGGALATKIKDKDKLHDLEGSP